MKTKIEKTLKAYLTAIYQQDLETMYDLHRWGFINKKGKMVIPPIYQTVSWFNEGLCAVEKGGKWGYINKKGKTILPFKFEEASAFSYGTAEISVYNSKGKLVEMEIDKKGRLVEE